MRHIALITLLLSLANTTAHSQDANVTSSSRSESERGCIDVEVNGERIRDYECLSKLLKPSDSDAPRRSASLRSEQIARSPSTKLGLANPEATRQRMGNTFGKSTLPQRPSQTTP